MYSTTITPDLNPSIKDIKSSLFIGGIKQVIPKREIYFGELVRLLRSTKQKELTAKIIAEVTDEEKQQLKLQSYFITPYGTFPYRENESIKHYNPFVIAFDFDKMSAKQVAKLIAIFIKSPSCILCLKSARQKGVKAIILISEAIPLKTHYLSLIANKAALLEALGASEFLEFLDFAQFKLSQPFFLSYDPDLHYNPDAEPLQINLIEPDVRTAERFAVREWDPSISESKTSRVEAYINTAVGNLCLQFEAETGARHPTIAKVKAIAGLFRAYSLPGEEQVYQQLENSVVAMYGGESEARAGNAFKSMRDAWEVAEPTKNESIEEILSNDFDFVEVDDYEPQETKPKKPKFLDKSFREKFKIDVTEKLEPPQVAIFMGSEIFGTLGNFSLIIGKAKAKKSFLIGMAIAAALTKK